MRSRVSEALGIDANSILSLLFSQPAALALGFVVSVWLTLFFAEKAGFKRRQSLELLIVAYLGALAVGRLLDVLSWGELFWKQPWRIFDAWFGGASTLGGLFGATIAVVIWSRYRNWNGLEFLDSIAPLAGLTVAFFKLGCFLSGCCFGARSTSPLALRFPEDSLVYYHQLGHGMIDQHYKSSLPVHPVQLYELALGLCIFLLLLFLRAVYPVQLRSRPGQTLWIGALLLLLGRFFVEFLRLRPDQSTLYLSGGQVACLIGLALLALASIGYIRRSIVGFLATLGR